MIYGHFSLVRIFLFLFVVAEEMVQTTDINDLFWILGECLGDKRSDLYIHHKMCEIKPSFHYINMVW